MGWFDWLKRKRARVNILLNKKLIASYDLTEDMILIGRALENIKQYTIKIPGNILIENLVNTTQVSRKHATLEWDPTLRKYRLRDHSAYGTFLNGKKLHKNNIGEIVEEGSNILISPFMFQLFYK